MQDLLAVSVGESVTSNPPDSAGAGGPNLQVNHIVLGAAALFRMGRVSPSS